MKKVLHLIILLLPISCIFSQQDDSGSLLRYRNRPITGTYNPERGFFQKAFTDKSGPRFMVTNEDKTFSFGVGGFVNIVGLGDFGGMVESTDFVTSLIPVTNDAKKGQFRLGAESSRINFKVIGSTKYGDLIAFIETDFRGAGNALRLRHAYISYYGFTVGQTWSTFMDLEAAPPTIDLEGPNTEISIRQPMVRYGGSFTENLSFAVAAEMNNTLINNYEANGIRSEYQRIPDFPLHIKYKNNFGHLQLGGVFRVMNYYDDTVAYKSESEVGYGAALSGKINIGKKNFFYFQGGYGRGIAKYVQDLSFANLDLILDLDKAGSLQTMPMYGSYFAFQRNWTETLYSAAIYSFTKLNPPSEYDNSSMIDYTHYFAVNLFWNFISHGTIGVEYLFGKRVNQDGNNGTANRIDLMVRYAF